jgi:hypothetical protein
MPSAVPAVSEGARHGHDTDLHALVHQDRHLKGIEHQLRGFLRDLVGEAAKTGHVRADIPPDELASYCLHAVSAAANAPSKPAVQRLVDLTLAGLRPTQDSR